MTIEDTIKDRGYLLDHPSFFTWREAFRNEWYEVIIRPYHRDGIEESVWACKNLEGRFAFRNFYDTIPKDVDSGIIFVFELELDAMTFKLRWM